MHLSLKFNSELSLLLQELSGLKVDDFQSQSSAHRSSEMLDALTTVVSLISSRSNFASSLSNSFTYCLVSVARPRTEVVSGTVGSDELD